MSDWSTVVAKGAKKKSVNNKKSSSSGGVGNQVQSQVLQLSTDPLILVLDTAAIIKGLQLGGDKVQLYTTDDVLEEVRDKKARQMLETLPFELKTREPSSEHIREVMSFAKRTGDYGFLSKTDLKVLALARMFEVEANGTKNLRNMPQKILTNPRAARRPVASTDDSSPNAAPSVQLNTNTTTDNVDTNSHTAADNNDSNDDTNNNDNDDDALNQLEQIEVSGDGDSEEENDDDDDDDATSAAPAQSSATSTDNHNADNDTAFVSVAGKSKPRTTAAARTTTTTTTTPVHDDDEEDPDGGEWINATNLQQHLNQAKYGTTEAKPASEVENMRVGCVTADFAMQNVLVQMGLRLVAPDGMLISQAKQWLLRCFACTQLVRDMSKLFCPACGNHTLKRVSVAVDCNGGVTRVYFSKKPISTRGTRFAMPMPRGGRNDPGDIVLTEDDLIRKTQYRHEPRSKSGEVAEFGRHEPNVVKGVRVGVRRRNPNSARKGLGKKNASRKRHL